MKTDLRRVRWLWLAAALTASLVAVGRASPGQGTPYRLTQDSTTTDAAGTAVLRGQFGLVPQISPLDWKVYALDWVYLEIATPDGPPRVLRGSGHYTVGGRGPITQRLTLDLRENTEDWHFDSGSVRVTADWPELDLELAATNAPTTLKLRVAAVPVSQCWRYQVLAGNWFLDNCAVCDRPTILVPLRGGFDLALIDSNPLFNRYHLFNLRLTDGAAKPDYEITGEGTLQIGGEVAIQQQWRLDVNVTTPAGGRRAILTNESAMVERRWPMLATSLAEDGGSLTSQYFLNLPAAPVRELWFNTVRGLTSGVTDPPNRISAADVLTDTGRVVRRGQNLLAAVGLSAATDASVDAFDVLPGGEIAFSLTAPAQSETLGALQEGDLLSENGKLLLTNQALVAAFGIMPIVPDLGLDAVRRLDTGEWLFSIRTPAFSERFGIMLGRGDLLGSSGRVVRSNAELLARFKPDTLDHDYGLDGFFIWPSGEIWFSTEEGFQDANLGPITDGDILSDEGYVVGKNLDLLRDFQPLEDLANFGLEGLFVVSDAALPPGEVGPKVRIGPQPGSIPTLTWTGSGRVFQVESTLRLGDPFAPVSLITTETQWSEPPAFAKRIERYFRVLSW